MTFDNQVVRLRQRVLVVTGTYLPGFRAGGPIQSVKNLLAQLGHEIQFDVITVDRDLGDVQPYSYINHGEWNQVMRQRVYYVKPGLAGLLPRWRMLRSTPHDVLYLNSFFDVYTTTWSLLLRALRLIPQRPVILAPHGEFSQGALSLKAAKKQLFLRLLRASMLLRDVIFQATSPAESKDIHRILGDVKVVEAPNLLPASSQPEREAHPTGTLRVAFVGRVNRMKNLDYALQVLRGVSHPIELSIVGPHEDQAYWAECQALLAQLPASVHAEVVGAVSPEAIDGIFRTHDVLLLPTQGENFGYVIAEALMAGCIPVISDRTPWNDMTTRGSGFTIPLEEPQRFTDVLNHLSGSPEYLAQVAREALRHGQELAVDTQALEQNRKLFWLEV